VNCSSATCEVSIGFCVPPVLPSENDGVPVKPLDSNSCCDALSSRVIDGLLRTRSARSALRPGTPLEIWRRKSSVT
jgi:hypothetical protein